MYIGKTRSPVLVIIFSIITLGIYAIYWFYTIMEDMNKLLDREYLSSILLILLSIICPPVAWYVLYKVDAGLVDLCRREGIPYKENFILWLLLTLVFGVGMFVAMFQITGAFNDIWNKRSDGLAPLQ